MQEKANLTLSYMNGEAGNGTVFVTVPLFFQLSVLFAVSGLFYMLLDENKWNIALNR